MRIKSKALLISVIGLALGCSIASQGAFAYQVEGQPEKGFFLVEVATTAPVMVVNGFWGKERITPQEYLDKRCVGAKVSEISYARGGQYQSDDIQIVFVMPSGGCKMAQP